MIVVIVLIAIGVGAWYYYGKDNGGAAGVSNPGATVATVNGTAITAGQLASAETSLEAQVGATASTTDEKVQLQSAALSSLIAQALLSQAASAAGVTASSTEIEAQLAQAKAQFSSDSDYQQALSQRGLTEATLRDQISQSLMIQAYLDKQLNLSAATATDAEIQTAYNQVASQNSSVPPLDQVRDQVAQAVVQQKQQAAINQYVQQLQAQANVQILISTSTPYQG